jgi:hypothetical protein
LLQNHRGIFSSQAYIKKANRESEILYHDAEWLNALADVLLYTRYACNCLAQPRGLDPVGHAGSFDDVMVIEAPPGYDAASRAAPTTHY